MTEAQIAWPKKTHELQNHTLDSARWNDFQYRDDDIVIGTWAKSGTTWVQQIVAQLIFKGEETPVAQLMAGTYSPWIECRFVPREVTEAEAAAKTHRRFLKTHLPVDALVFSPNAKYIYIGRDARDAIWSWYHHHKSFTPFAYEMMNETPGLVGRKAVPPDCDIRTYYNRFLDGDPDVGPGWPLWSNVQSWFDVRALPNVHLVHYANLKADMESEIRTIAEFLDINIAPKLWPTIFEHCTFDYMKEAALNGDNAIAAQGFEGGASTFFNKGTNGRWKDVLSAAEIARCDEVAAQHLSPECAHWLATGELPYGEK